MKCFALTTLVTLLGVAPLLAQSNNEGRMLAELSFETVDENGNGFVDMGESHDFGLSVFDSMDADEDELLSEAEFLGWGYGFHNIATERDKEQAYRTAMRVVFSFWDRDHDGQITRTEHRLAANNDFRRADLNNDALLSKEEFFGGFSVMVATRIALAPDVQP
ncbi:MAG: signal transduction protein [Rhodobacteraceae bacterium]|nr:signal transduction protein [Paracoccaceae bacterium]